MLRNYILLAWKVLWRRKFFTFVSLFGISITLAILTLVATLVDLTFGAHDPEVHADRTLGIYEIELIGEERHWRAGPGYRFLDSHIRDLPSAEDMTIASTPSETAAYIDGEKISLRLIRTDGAFWRILRFDFLEGIPFTDRDEAEARPVAVISRHTRQRFFGDAPAVGRRIEVAGQRFEVVGVVENVSTFRSFSAADLWVPISTSPSNAYRDQLGGSFQARILAASEEDLPAIRAETRSRIQQVDVAAEGFETLATAAETPFENLARNILGDEGSFASIDRSDGEGGSEGNPAAKLRLAIVLGVLLFLSLPSLNLINLSISRILERSSEIGVRKAFGASSAALVSQLMLENILLTLLGGLLALPMAALALRAISGTSLVGYATVGMGLESTLAGLVLALVLGVLSGAYPAWRMSRLHPNQALRESL